jgi:hypothetical protein
MPARKDEEGLKQCGTCGEIKCISEFWKSGKRRKDGTQAYRFECKQCHSTRTGHHMRISKLKEYGITPEFYEQERQKQKGCCLICQKHETEEQHGKLNVDHDHKTGKYRALLCTNCNHGLGKFSDDPERLKKAIEYLNASSSRH